MSEDAAEVKRFRVAPVTIDGVECVVAGTGYTGEDGLELAVPARTRRRCGTRVIGAGVEPAGLGARDTLRLEVGLPLHGHELGPGITPLQAGLGWVIGWDKGDFLGRAALEAEQRRRPGSPAAWHLGRGPPARPRRRERARRRDAHGRRHERQLLADARACDRARLPPARGRAGYTGRARRPRPLLTGRVVPLPFVDKAKG